MPDAPAPVPVLPPAAPAPADAELRLPWRCPACKREIPRGSIRCRHCGVPFRLREPAWNDRKSIYVLLFLVAFEFGLPWLWRSPHFTRAEKAVLTVLTFIYFPAVLAIPFYLAQQLMLKLLALRQD